MSKQVQKNEGEGNKTADREYREAAKEHAQSGRSQPKAREAAEALDEEGDELEEAERAGKSKQQG